MAATTWPTPNWPEDVANDVSGYEKPLFSILDDTANEYPNQVYTIFNDATRTFAQVKDSADRIANFLASRGIQKGDRVAIFLPNLPHYPAIFFGILKAGAVCVTCNPLYTVNELNYYGSVDELRLEPRWNSNKDLSSLKGKTIRLKFYLYNAKLYAFQIKS